MNYNKHQQILNIASSAVLIVIGIVLVLASAVIKKPESQVIMAAEEPIQGYRISPPLALEEIKNVSESKIEWEAAIPGGTNIIIKTAVTPDGDNPPELDDDTVWRGYEIEQAEGSVPIPGIEPGNNLTDLYLWTMQILGSDIEDVSPELHSLTETIKGRVKTEGYRISPEFALSEGAEEEIIKDSRIFWQADERFDGNIEVKVNVLAGGQWTYEQDVVNGERIPGLEPGKDLSGARIQTKTSFIGGPHFYPSLEDIKIFIESE